MLTGDQHHQRALAVWAQLRTGRTSLVTTDFVFDEVVTFVRYREGLPLAMRLGSSIMASTLVDMIMVDRRVLDRAWELFGSVLDAELSLTDCTSFAVIESLGIRRVFTYDEDFRATGAMLLS